MKKFECKCVGITAQSKECYDQQITLPIPPHMKEYENNRIKNGNSALICIDPCIVDVIKYLWSHGITTYGCCCGHNDNSMYPLVNVADSDIDKMLELGYKQRHYDPSRKDTFELIKTN